MIFWAKFAKKRYLWSKAEKASITIGSCIFKLVAQEETTIEFVEPEIQKNTQLFVLEKLDHSCKIPESAIELFESKI